MSDGPILEAPDHVQAAMLDEDIRRAAIEWATEFVIRFAPAAGPDIYSTEHAMVRRVGAAELMARAIRILRHFDRITEHGDGVVSFKE